MTLKFQVSFEFFNKLVKREDIHNGKTENVKENSGDVVYTKSTYHEKQHLILKSPTKSSHLYIIKDWYQE